ncbi:MAG: phage terminase large subunit family protein [Planctomycetes bacterium]|nr:phage terminase large subunit family protein [Planctomycetota bacterium]
MNRFEWCESFINLRGRPISFKGRPYLPAVYNSTARRIVLRCSRQVEKTTFICNVVAHAAVTIPGLRIVIVFPRQDQAGVFANSRLMPAIRESPIIQRILLGNKKRSTQITNLRFANGVLDQRL